MSQAKFIERSVYPYAVMLQTIPILAIVPLIGFAFGFNFRSRVLVCVLIAMFPIITNTLFGLLSVDHGQHDLFTLHGVGRWRRLWKLQFPGRPPQHLHRPAHLRRTVGHRRGRRRLLLPSRDQPGHRRPDQPLQRPPGVRPALRRGHHDLGARDPRLRLRRASSPSVSSEDGTNPPVAATTADRRARPQNPQKEQSQCPEQ